MAPVQPRCAYKETRLNLDPAPSATVAITPQRLTQKRLDDENGFRYSHLATAASIYHRRYHSSPKSFLWRILEDGKVLAIRVVDVSRQATVPDASLTLRVSFPSAIRTECIAFADPLDHDVLNVFVLLETNHLYTLTLRPDFFRKVSSTEGNVGEWCKVIQPTAYASSQIPHRLAALSSDELVIANYSGGLSRLVKQSGSDGSEWTQTQHSEANFKSNLKGMISWNSSNMRQFGKHKIDISAATSISSSYVNISGTLYAFMISLDHKMRIWNFQSNKIVYTRDILNQIVDPNAATKPYIDPSNSQLLKVYENEDDDTAMCVTYSPSRVGEFKFWKVEADMTGELVVTDIFPNNQLKPQNPDNAWTFADFGVVEERVDSTKYSIWILWKNNTAFEVQKLEFHPGSVQKVQASWMNEWVTMAKEHAAKEHRADSLDALEVQKLSTPNVLSGDCADSTDKWLEFILTPGRYTTAIIETGLSIYATGSGFPKDTVQKSGSSLPEKLCNVIASVASLNRGSDGQMAYEQFRAATHEYWDQYHKILLMLDKQRGEALSLVIDPGRMPWVVIADGAIAVRDCSSLENIWHNPYNVAPGTELVASLLTSAAKLRSSMTGLMRHNFNTALLNELFEEPSSLDFVRMRSLYDRCDFANQIGDDEFEELQRNLGGRFTDVTPQVYEALFRLMISSEDVNIRQHLLPLAEYGNKLVIKGVQNTVELHRDVCLDQLFLLILIEAEINHGDEGIGFNATSIFDELVTILKRLELVHWLATTQISLPIPKALSNSITEKTLPTNSTPSTETITTLEGVLRHLFAHNTTRQESLSTVFTEMIVQICDPESMYELVPSLIQCFLLKNGRSDLAMEFSRFTLLHPFDVYIQGRVHLSANDALGAAALFKKAAFGIGVPDPGKHGDFRSAGFLDDTERNLLNAGLPAYYSHIVALYDKEKAYSFVIDFARLALQFTKTSDDLQNTQLRSEMHSRLFTATIQTCRWELAHSTLILFTDTALQQSSLRTLVTRMCESSHATELLALPLLGLQDAVDSILEQKCEGILDVTVGVPYHKILYSWRIKRNDFRGAAAISLERLQRLQHSGAGDRIADGLETPVTKQYLILINALCCVNPKQAWILSEEAPHTEAQRKLAAGTKPKRRVVTLEDVRKEYQTELDRLAAIQNNQFAFAGGDEMEIDIT